MVCVGGGVAKETILILDAEKNVTWTLMTLLESEGYPAVIVNSIGIKATFKRGGVAQVILTAAGDGAKEMVVHYTGSWVTSRLWQRQSQAKVAGIGRSQIQT